MPYFTNIDVRKVLVERTPGGVDDGAEAGTVRFAADTPTFPSPEFDTYLKLPNGAMQPVLANVADLPDTYHLTGDEPYGTGR
jgi:hypothetical protein